MSTSGPPTPSGVDRFRGWLWQPPWAHGEIEAERRVSFLELFYDLVYVVVIAQASHHLAGSLSVRGYLEFVIIFAVIWVAWANGTLYYELRRRRAGAPHRLVAAGPMASRPAPRGDPRGGLGFAVVRPFQTGAWSEPGRSGG